MTTQTDSAEMQDLQVQVNLGRDDVTIEHQSVQTMKTENATPNILMPNIPSSVNQTNSKKRKLSSARPATVPTQNDSEDMDPAILNSEVYKIYCQNEDPKEAMKQIKNMKSCFFFEESTWSLPQKEIWKKNCEKILEKLWSRDLGKSKWEKIQAFLSGKITEFYFFREEVPVSVEGNIEQRYFYDVTDNCFTKIEVMLPNGIEFWYVENFDGGAGASKWYRGVSSDDSEFGRKMVKLKIIGLQESIIEKYYYEFLKKTAKISWMKFAETVADSRPRYFYSRQELPKYASPISSYDVKESKTEDAVVVNVSLRFWYRTFSDNYITYSEHTLDVYHGKSTRPVKRTRRPKNENEEMTNEAKKAALMECFKDRFGITEFKDILVDELHRPQSFEAQTA